MLVGLPWKSPSLLTAIVVITALAGRGLSQPDEQRQAQIIQQLRALCDVAGGVGRSDLFHGAVLIELHVWLNDAATNKIAAEPIRYTAWMTDGGGRIDVLYPSRNLSDGVVSDTAMTFVSMPRYTWTMRAGMATIRDDSSRESALTRAAHDQFIEYLRTLCSRGMFERARPSLTRDAVMFLPRERPDSREGSWTARVEFEGEQGQPGWVCEIEGDGADRGDALVRAIRVPPPERPQDPRLYAACEDYRYVDAFGGATPHVYTQFSVADGSKLWEIQLLSTRPLSDAEFEEMVAPPSAETPKGASAIADHRGLMTTIWDRATDTLVSAPDRRRLLLLVGSLSAVVMGIIVSVFLLRRN
ncbi:MAG: hypothetical protein ACTS22_08145 [Phycisphaerales bacterium]